MRKDYSLLILTLLFIGFASVPGRAETAPDQKALPEKGAQPPAGAITVQEMLVTGHPQLKMHSLVMILQGNVTAPIDDSFLPGLTACATGPHDPIRALAAQVLGKHFVERRTEPDEKAVALLQKLADDESPDVRFNAVYYGLTRIQKKSEKTVEMLLVIAAKNREKRAYERIVESLAGQREEVTRILDRRLADDGDIANFEIYEDFTGKVPTESAKYLNLPSSRPCLFVFKGTEKEPKASESALKKQLAAIGIKAPTIRVSGLDENHVLLVTTYITKERIALERNFSGEGKFQFSQQMWLTPQAEARIEAMQSLRKKRAAEAGTSDSGEGK